MFFAGISEGLGIMSIVLVVQVLQGNQSATNSHATNLIFEKLEAIAIALRPVPQPATKISGLLGEL